MKKLILLSLIAGCCAYFGFKFYLHYRVSSALDMMLIMAAPFAQIQYQGVSSSISGKISIDDKGDVKNPEYVWYIWSGGKYAEK